MTWTLTAVRKGIEQRRRTQRVCVLPAIALASIQNQGGKTHEQERKSHDSSSGGSKERDP